MELEKKKAAENARNKKAAEEAEAARKKNAEEAEAARKIKAEEEYKNYLSKLTIQERKEE